MSILIIVLCRPRFVLSNGIFESKWCLVELEAAITARVPCVAVRIDGSQWEGKNFPDVDAASIPERVIADGGRGIEVRPLLRQLFMNKVIEHSREYFDAFYEKFRVQLPAPTGTASNLGHGGSTEFEKVAPAASNVGSNDGGSGGGSSSSGGSVALDEFVRIYLAFRGDVSSWNSERERQLKLKISQRCNLNMPLERIKVFKEKKRARAREEGSSVEVCVKVSDEGFIQVNTSLDSSSDDERNEEVGAITEQIRSKVKRFFDELRELAAVHVTAEFVEEFEFRFVPPRRYVLRPIPL